MTRTPFVWTQDNSLEIFCVGYESLLKVIPAPASVVYTNKV